MIEAVTITIDPDTWPWKDCIEILPSGEACGRPFRAMFASIYNRCERHHDPDNPKHFQGDR